jgi:tetratricopeptide (TPR) repeat protein
MRVLALLGAAQFLAGDREESLRHLLDAATTDPSQMAIVAWLAQLLEGSGRVAEAAWLLQQTHKHAPQDVPLILMLVRLLTAHPELAGADPDQAIALGREAVRLTGDQDPMAWHALALAEGAAGHVQEARQAARRALQLARAGGDEQLSQWLNAELQPFLEGQSR